MEQVFKMRETFLAFESYFDAKDMLPEVTSCLNLTAQNRKAEIADVVVCLQRLGVPDGPPVWCDEAVSKL